MITKAQVVTKAREYLGTKFRHQGRLKGQAIDCVGLPLMIAEEFGLWDREGVLIHSRDSVNYSPQPLDSFVHEECKRRLIEKPVSEMTDGDVVTVRNPVIPCHVAIVAHITDYLSVIHAHNGIGRVVEHILTDELRALILGCFSFPGVE